MDEATIQKRRWAILAVLVVCLLVVILDNTILNVALKTIQQDLGASQSQMQWAVDSYALVFAGLLIPAGVFGDRLGRKTVLMVGMLAFGSTSLLCSYAHNPTELILYRALMGIGAALVQPQTLSIIQNVFAPQERAKAIGIWAGASGIAIALGPITGGLLLKYFWWGSIFLVNVPIVIVGLIAICILVPELEGPEPGTGRAVQHRPAGVRARHPGLRRDPGRQHQRLAGLGLDRRDPARRGAARLLRLPRGAQRPPDDRRAPVPQPAVRGRQRRDRVHLLRPDGRDVLPGLLHAGGARLHAARRRRRADRGRGRRDAARARGRRS